MEERVAAPPSAIRWFLAEFLFPFTVLILILGGVFGLGWLHGGASERTKSREELERSDIEHAAQIESIDAELQESTLQELYLRSAYESCNRRTQKLEEALKRERAVSWGGEPK